MAGHSHYKNTKWRREREKQKKSELFLKVLKKLEISMKEGKIDLKEALSIARENKIPKEKVYKIDEKLKKRDYSSDG